MKGNGRYRLPVTEGVSHKDASHITGTQRCYYDSRTMTRGLYTCAERNITNRLVKSLCRTLETIRTFYINHTSVKKKNKCLSVRQKGGRNGTDGFQGSDTVLWETTVIDVGDYSFVKTYRT